MTRRSEEGLLLPGWVYIAMIVAGILVSFMYCVEERRCNAAGGVYMDQPMSHVCVRAETIPVTR